ncbi:hypothetical protein PanWU01x14_357600, partial [Parasponia andersonii]
NKNRLNEKPSRASEEGRFRCIFDRWTEARLHLVGACASGGARGKWTSWSNGGACESPTSLVFSLRSDPVLLGARETLFLPRQYMPHQLNKINILISQSSDSYVSSSWFCAVLDSTLYARF